MVGKTKFSPILILLLFCVACSGPIKYSFIDTPHQNPGHSAILKNLHQAKSNIILYEVNGTKPQDKNPHGMAAQYGNYLNRKFIIYLKPGKYTLSCGYSQFIDSAAGLQQNRTEQMASVTGAGRIKVSFTAVAGHEYLLTEKHWHDSWIPLLIDTTTNKQLYPTKGKSRWKVEIKESKR